MKYDAVIFDLFGTLVPSMEEQPYVESLGRTAAAAGAEADAFRRIWRRDDVAHRRFTGGFASQAECIEHVCRELGLSPSPAEVQRAADVRFEFERRLLTPRGDAVETVRKIKQAGAKLGLLSVCSADAPRHWPGTLLACWFDEAAFSTQAGLVKPDPAFYHLLCRRLGVQPARCLYVGDGAGEELTGATRAGLQAVLLCPPGEEHVILARPEARNWPGPRIRRLSELLTLIE